MHVLIPAPGSRGDVEPAARIGHDLVAVGHTATVVAQRDYAEIVRRAGCTPALFDTPLEPPPGPDGRPPGAAAYLPHLRAYMRDAAATALRAAAGDSFAGRTATAAGATAAEPGPAVDRQTTPADAIITNAVSPYGHDLARALGIPSTTTLLQPDRPSRAYPPMIASRLTLGPLGNLTLGRLAAAIPSPVHAATLWVREQLGLPPRDPHTAPAGDRDGQVHHGISPILLPRPADWPEGLTLDGTWWPVPQEPGWQPDAELADFLAAGPPPVVITMGSAGVTDAAAAALREVIAARELRCIVQGAGWAEAAASAAVHSDADRAGSHHPAASRSASSGTVLFTGNVPHSWLLQRAAACVHQAGAGSAAACIRAGIPSVPLPQHTDQFFWARRLQALGAAPTIPRRSRITAESLSAALTTVTTDQRLLHRTAALSRRMQVAEGLPDLAAASAFDKGTLPSTAALRDWAAGHV